MCANEVAWSRSRYPLRRAGSRVWRLPEGRPRWKPHPSLGPETISGRPEGLRAGKEHARDLRSRYTIAPTSFPLPSTAGHATSDAPDHFRKTAKPLDAIPLEQLIGPAVGGRSCRGKCDADRDYRSRSTDFRDWEKAQGEIPSTAIVLLRTGFEKYWPIASAISAPTHAVRRPSPSCTFGLRTRRRRLAGEASGKIKARGTDHREHR